MGLGGVPGGFAMRSRKSKFGRSSAEAEMLESERFGIERHYLELDDSILHGEGSARILDAAQKLVKLLLVHLTHEEQLRSQIAFPVLDDPRAEWKKNMSELLQIEAGLTQSEIYAALRLRSFCKGWIHLQRMWTSIFQPAPLPESVPENGPENQARL